MIGLGGGGRREKVEGGESGEGFFDDDVLTCVGGEIPIYSVGGCGSGEDESADLGDKGRGLHGELSE